MTTTRDRVLKSLEIGWGDFVVEVGGGHEPFVRSDLILDKYPFDNLHRSQDLVHAAPVMIADASYLPLPDAGCDLIFASHIIEHLPHPEAFLTEVARCSRRVYLEFPGRNRELMFGWAMHEWLVEVEGVHLTFYRNDIPQLFGDFFHRNYDFLLDAWMMRRHTEVNSHLYAESSQITWEIAELGAFKHLTQISAHGRDKIDKTQIAEVDYELKQLATLSAQKVLPPRLFAKLVELRRRKRRGVPRPVTAQLLDRLMCLHCRRSRSLTLRSANQIVCRSCEASYGQRGGLFDLDIASSVTEELKPTQASRLQLTTEHHTLLN